MVRLPSLRRLAVLVSGYPGFEKPKPRLEQYVTDPELAARIAFETAIRACPAIVADFGVGTGLLLYAISLTGCLAYGVGIDIDEDAVTSAKRNLSERKLLHLVDLVVGDCRAPPLRHESIDIVVSNPPFGMRSERGIDTAFVRAALQVSRVSVISLHAWSDGLLEALARKTRCRPQLLYIGYQRIPAFLEHHRRRVHRVKVAIVECRRVEA